MTVDSKVRGAGDGVGAVQRDPGDWPGLLLGRLTALPVLVFAPFLMVGFPFLLVGYFRPIPVLVCWVALAAALVPYGWRRIPSVTWAGTRWAAGADPAKPTPRWSLWSLLAVSVGFGVFNAVFHSQFVIVEYDAAAYLQFGNWISQHGTAVIAENAQAFGGHPASITYASAAFFQVDGHVVPQFMAGLPMVLSLGFWSGGTRLALLGAPLLAAVALFTFGGLAARLVGPRWAPFAALALGVTVPMQYVSRDTWSEPLALIFLTGGLSLWIDSQRTDGGAEDAGSWRTDWRQHSRSASHVLAGFAGLSLGLILLIRIDGPADILFAIPYCGLLIARRQRQVVPLMGGLILGTLYGVLDGAFVTLPYLRINKQSVEGEAAAVILMILGTLVAERWLRRRGAERRNPPRPWLVKAVVFLPFVILAAGVIRPYVERNWAALQDAPLSLHWLYWFAGGVTIAFAVVGFAVLGRRCVTGDAPLAVLPVLVFGWAILWFLVRPAITPHFPMASRRLVPAVLPGLILVAVWLAAWLARRSRAAGWPRVPGFKNGVPRAAVIALCALGIALQPLLGNLTGLAFKRTFTGEVAALGKVCQGIPAGSSVLIIDAKMMLEFGQAIRGTCDVPVAGAQTTIPGGFQPDGGIIIEPATIVAAVAAIEKSGHRPLVLGATTAEFAPLVEQFGAGAQKLLMAQRTQDDQHVQRSPTGTVTEKFTVYSWAPPK